eukprot:TRINITY_DN4138_c0_g1_i2.p1 TRINITY_DN4138_c0_g1~~TRINITY_DN4138_c0_g1_i2.p1  ORF type:complete len:287 (-),score=38.48 TRINITY_DN4138_c0_g1_i2:108-968(-)
MKTSMLFTSFFIALVMLVSTVASDFDTFGTITTVTPNSGEYSGGFTVTISGTSLGSGSDITRVSIGGISSTTTSPYILSQSATSVTFIAGDLSALKGTSASVTVDSASLGSSTLAASFSVLMRGIDSLTPNSGTTVGSERITITGNGLGNGTDITAVSLASINARIVSQTTNAVVVIAGEYPGAVTADVSGAVRVQSVTQGVTQADAVRYTYTAIVNYSNGLAAAIAIPVSAGVMVLVLIVLILCCKDRKTQQQLSPQSSPTRPMPAARNSRLKSFSKPDQPSPDV